MSFHRSIATADWTVAERAVSALASLGTPDSGLCRAELLSRLGQATEARAQLQALLSSATEERSPDVQVRSRLLLADLHCLSNDPAGAVPHLLSATGQAGHHRLDHLHTLAVLQLAHCHLMLGCPDRALHLTRLVVIAVICVISVLTMLHPAGAAWPLSSPTPR